MKIRSIIILFFLSSLSFGAAAQYNHWGDYSTVASDDFLLRAVRPSTGQHGQLVVYRILNRFYPAGSHEPSAFEVEGHSGHEVISRAESDFAHDRFVSASEIPKAISEASSDVNVEFGWPTLYGMLDKARKTNNYDDLNNTIKAAKLRTNYRSTRFARFYQRGLSDLASESTSPGAKKLVSLLAVDAKGGEGTADTIARTAAQETISLVKGGKGIDLKGSEEVRAVEAVP